MTTIERRISDLERRGTAEESVLVVVGEPDARQQAIIDAGTARLVVQIPDNGRGDHGQHSKPT